MLEWNPQVTCNSSSMSLLSRNSLWRKFPACPCETSSLYTGLCALLSRDSLRAVTQSSEVSVSAGGTEAHPACNERSCRRAWRFIKTLKYPHVDEREHGTSRMRPAHENQRKTHTNPHRDMNESGSTFDFCGSVVINQISIKQSLSYQSLWQ